MRQEEEAAPFLGSQARAAYLQHARAHTSQWVERAKDRLNVPLARGATFSRKQLLIAAACVLLLLTLLLPSSRSHISSLASSTTSRGPCSNARLNPNHIKAPNKPDVAALTAFWPAVKEAIVNGGKDLPTLERPAYQDHPFTEQENRARTELLTAEQAAHARELHAAFLDNIPSFPKKTFKGKGVVILAGGRYSEYAATSLGVLRESGSKLPVEVWRRDEREEKHGWCDEIEAEGMACRRLSDYLDTDLLGIRSGLALKIVTIMFSSFEEVVFIDSDNLPLKPPERLFQSKAYKDTGAILWPDFWKYDNIDWLDYIVGISDNRTEALWTETTYESGQMVWNKKRHWRALLLAVYYNYYGDDLYYTLINHGFAGWGDKDTFALALRAAGEPFHTIPNAPADAWANGKVGDRRNGMLQMDPTQKRRTKEEDKPTAFFMHATTAKWSHRQFLCDRCLPIWHTKDAADPFVSNWEDANAEFHPQLHSDIRLLDIDGIRPYMPGGIGDPEVRLWRAMEYNACQSPAWRHGRTCEVARRYMMHAHGFSFVLEKEPGKNVTEANGGEEWLPAMGAEVCLVDPL